MIYFGKVWGGGGGGVKWEKIHKMMGIFITLVIHLSQMYKCFED